VHIQQSGQVKRLSVAVLVDGTYAVAEDGTATYAPRSPEELDQIAKLVKSAIGFDENRGDSVEVVNMRFAEPIEAGADEGAGLLMGFTRGDVIRMIEIGVLGLLGVLALLFGVRPILRGIAAVTPAPMIPQLAGPAGAAQLPPGDASGQMMAAAENGEDGRALSTEIDRMIDVNQIEGRVRASSLKKVGELVQNHPDEAVNIMRSWMYQNQ